MIDSKLVNTITFVSLLQGENSFLGVMSQASRGENAVLHSCSIEVSFAHHHFQNGISTNGTGQTKVQGSVALFDLSC